MVKPVYNLPEDPRDDAAAVRHWLEALPENYPPEDRERLARACDLLLRCRGNQDLDTGETQVRHLLCTADILVRLRMDADTLIATLLNGCYGHLEEDGEPPAVRFGPGIADMLEDLARIDRLANVDAVIAAKERREHEENLRRLLLGIAKDVRVVLVVLAERLHLMRSLAGLDAERRREIAQDTRQVYAPLANRLGVWQLKWELEDLAMRSLEPDDYKRIARRLDGRRAERESFVATAIAALEERFAAAGIDADISGRPKHIYSIWRKMQRKNVELDQIFDLRAVRVLVRDVASCYAALGIVHGLWKHIPKEFDDYIATPKGNLYQSLHTVVVGPADRPLEVQIRTWDMHRHAELGVAAHWAYKESKQQDAAFQRRMTLMRNWLELKHEGEDGGDFVERFKSEFEPAHIYVLTPQAKVIELPRGATALDFAYAIHSEIGNRCRGAKVDGGIAPLNRPLTSGQTVEILTRGNAAPSRDWLEPHRGYLKTAKARNRVRQWFKRQNFDQDVELGRSLLEKELSRLRIEEKPRLAQLCLRYNLHAGEDLLAALGRGEIPVGQVAHQVGEPRGEERNHPLAKPATPASGTGGGPDRAAVIVAGVPDLMTHPAQCCKPIPYDEIVGFITRGRGVTIHRRDCANILSLPEREKARLSDEVHWAEQSLDAVYRVDLLVIAADRKGLLRDISSVFSDTDIDVVGVHTASDRAREIATMRFTVELEDGARLEQVHTRLRQLPDVLEIKRPHA
ncbi:MAG: bifunctional (p)ppGpp synthetase/guanosine-3',5'-bis(diphosphate) 3'-pyrophosphohydrolase [Candidatus Thiosymbion ectosymbiont of Robbea hypermnestra]|nr:bifunctional (p)ppGpp synthetase/guanosine-3',5'-bis(diphosphate) 3'-pyrophosphohydrolase [Candidatus Thiosymbion ectosymbiont of Robbea hypermnestra]